MKANVVQSVLRVCLQRLQPLMGIRNEPNFLRRVQTPNDPTSTMHVRHVLKCVIKGKIFFEARVY